MEQAVADEVQELQHDYAAFCGGLSESQQTRLAAISTASDQRTEHKPSAPGSVLASFATAAAAVDERAIPGPGPFEICIAPGGLSAVPEVASGCQWHLRLTLDLNAILQQSVARRRSKT